MAAPTDLLNEDVKELKGELRDVRSNLEVIKADVHRIDNGLAELRAEFRFAKWLVGGLLALTVSGIGVGIWRMATLTADVRNLELRMDERFKAVDARVDKLEARMESRFDRADARFDRLEASIGRLAEQLRAGPGPAAAK